MQLVLLFVVVAILLPVFTVQEKLGPHLQHLIHIFADQLLFFHFLLDLLHLCRYIVLKEHPLTTNLDPVIKQVDNQRILNIELLRHLLPVKRLNNLLKSHRFHEADNFFFLCIHVDHLCVLKSH